MPFKNIYGVLNEVVKTAKDVGTPLAKECGKSALKASDIALKKTIQISKETVDHAKETFELRKQSANILETVKNRLDECATCLSREQSVAKDHLEELGKLKFDIFQNEMRRFQEILDKVVTDQLHADVGRDYLREESIKLKIAPETAAVLGKGVAAGIASGTVSYASVALLGSASTGTAISALHGAAATKATLAFLGGGSLAAGGSGVAGGIAVLGSIVAAPVLIASGFALDKGIRRQYEVANAYQAESEKEIEQMNKLIHRTREITDVVKTYKNEMVKLRGVMEPVLNFTGEQHRDMQRQEINGFKEFPNLMIRLLEEPIIDPGDGSICLKAYQTIEDHRMDLKKANNEWTEHIKNLIIRKNELEQELFRQERQFNALIEKYKKQASQKNNEKGALRFLELKNDLERRHSCLEEESLEFLATAQYLAEEGNRIEISAGSGREFDYSLSVVGYCKVIEYELRVMLAIPEGKKFVEIIDYIEKSSMPTFRNHINDLHELRKERNGSAHSSIASGAKIKRVENLIFGVNGKSGLLAAIEEAKK